ncbi:hypothetical protein ACFLV5_06200 [Chloroflexota bacterium]
MSSRNKKSANILVFVLSGIFGFGIGGIIGGVIWFAYDAPHLGFAILGAIGGASLGAALREWKKIWILALVGALGFDIGFLVGFFFPLVIWEPINGQGFLIGTIGGAIGGAAIGIALKNWEGTGLLALASAIGFSIAVWFTWDTLRGLTPQVLWGGITPAIWGAVGGTFLGLALGFLDNRRHHKKT